MASALTAGAKPSKHPAARSWFVFCSRGERPDGQRLQQDNTLGNNLCGRLDAGDDLELAGVYVPDLDRRDLPDALAIGHEKVVQATNVQHRRIGNQDRLVRIDAEAHVAKHPWLENRLRIVELEQDSQGASILADQRIEQLDLSRKLSVRVSVELHTAGLTGFYL